MSLIGRINLLVVSASRHASKSLAETRRLKRGLRVHRMLSVRHR